MTKSGPGAARAFGKPPKADADKDADLSEFEIAMKSFGGDIDMSFKEAGEWIASELAKVDLSDTLSITDRMSHYLGKLPTLDSTSVRAHAHMQVIHQLEGVLHTFPAANDIQDMDERDIERWMGDVACRTDLGDAFAVADRICASTAKLADPDLCERWPGSARAHRRLVEQFGQALSRIPRTIH